MNSNQIFSIKRTALLIKKSMYEKKSSILKGFYILFGIFSVVYFISTLNNATSTNTFYSLYYAGLFLMGMITAGMAFDNFRSKEQSISYLSLPASNFEKFISEFILTLFGFITAYTIVFYIFNVLATAISRHYGIEASVISIVPTSGKAIKEIIIGFLIMHSVFFAGAATFRKAPRISTGFTIFIVGILLIAFTSLLAWIFLKDMGNTHIDKQDLFIESYWLEIAKFTINYLVAPVFWLVAFFKVKEKSC